MTAEGFEIFAEKLANDENKTNLSILSLIGMDTVHDKTILELVQCFSLETIVLEKLSKITSGGTIRATMCATTDLKSLLIDNSSQISWTIQSIVMEKSLEREEL